jgi:ubiquinone/menaquinone biosynthesis C-methylase UbiE
VRGEFTRQAESFTRAFERRDTDTIDRIVRALAGTAEMRVLDAACGPGIVSAEVAPWVRELLGVDATDAMLERARARCIARGLANTRFQIADVASLPFGDGHFDAALCRLAVHHFPYPEIVLAELARVLRPAGRLVLADIVTADDPAEAKLHNALEQLRDPTHVAMLPAAVLVRQIEAVGLEVTATDTWTSEREFEEWLEIVAAPERAKSLRAVMGALADAGVRAGVNLHWRRDSLVFEQRWLLVTAEKPAML